MRALGVVLMAPEGNLLPRRDFVRFFQVPGLSGILCARPVSSLADEPFTEDDGELCLGLEPFARRSFPFVGRVIEHQV